MMQNNHWEPNMKLLRLIATTILLAGCSARQSAVAPPSPAPVAAIIRAAPADGFHAVVDPKWGIFMRESWTKAEPDTTKVAPMGKIQLITVMQKYEENPFDSVDPQEIAAHLELTRQYHTADRHWADISYHFAVDRAGRIWQCRPLAYQGSFSMNKNQANIGVNIMGDPDAPVPDPQKQATIWLLEALRVKFNVPVTRIYTMSELASTAEPGPAVIDFMKTYRNGTLKINAMKNVRGD
jgi:hypothetical protein